MTTANESSTSRGRAAAVALVPLLLAIVLSAATIPGDFVFDDMPIVRDNDRIASITEIPSLFVETYWGDVAESHLYRPMTLATFAVERAVWGTDSAGPYHAVNVLLLGCAAAMIGLVALRIGLAWGPALVAGVLFAAHPIHIEPVATVVGRSELGAGLFMLVTLWIAIGSGRSALSAVGSGAALLIALLFKENAIAVVPILFLLPLFVPGEDGTWLQRLLRGMRTRLTMWIGVGVALVVWFLLRTNAVHGQDHIVGEMDNLLFYRPALARIAGGLEVSLQYHRMALWPWPQSADYSKAAIDPTTTLAALRPILGAVSWIMLFTVPWLLRRRFPVAGLFLLLYAFALLPVANLLMPIGTIFAERLLFLPSMGICIAIAAFAAPLMDAGRAPRGVVWAGTAAVVALGAFAFIVRVPEWRTEHAVAEAIVRVQPDSAKGHLKLGSVLNIKALTETGSEGERLRRDAEGHLLRAIEIHPDAFGAHSKLCVLYENAGRNQEAAVHARELMRIAPNDPLSLAAQARARVRVGSLTEALQLYDEAIEQHPDAVVLLVGRASLHAGRKETEKAAADFERILELEPWHAGILAQYTQMLFDAGDLNAVRALLDRQLDIDWRHPAFETMQPRLPQLYGQRGFVLAELGEHQAAIDDFGMVLSFQPNMLRARRSRAASLIALGRFDEAAADLDAIAAAQGPGSVAKLRQQLERARREGGG